MPASFNNHIESLRGFLAIVVVIHHLSNLGKNIDPAFTPNHLDLCSLPGHIAVLVFFVLSGYLIGLTNKEQMNYDEVMPYLKKRAIRLYPIYALSMALVLIYN
jgi:peptidoglycan/LPS O-acetylase OafA/YrhL